MELPNQVDVGIVLGASLRNDIPSPGLKERLDHTIKLYREKRFTQIIVSGGLDHNGSKLTEAEGMQNYLVENGIPKKHIWLEPKATSTYENLTYSKRIMEKQGFISAIVITHDFHGSRSLDIAESVGIDHPWISTTSSEALFMPYHEARETLAYTKWMLTKLQLKVGLIPTR
ncbi:vancomycin high temperature exclusion protein [compost metagenome]